MKSIVLNRPQVHIGNDPRDMKFYIMNPITHGLGIKPEPMAGLWLSSYDEKIGCEWWEWTQWNMECKGDAWYCVLHQDTSLVYINSWEDWKELWKRYIIRKTLGLRFYLFKLNFELMVRDGWDGIHLTSHGQWKTRFVPEDVGWYDQPTLYGWDCECTLLFTNKIIYTKKIEMPEIDTD